MTRPQDLYADEVNRLVRVAWTNPEGYNAAYPDDLIYPTRSMPFFIADHGWYVNGVKTDELYPDIPEDYTVPLYPPEWARPLDEISVDEPYSGPLELDGKPVQIQPGSRWPVGYRRQKDTWSIIQQAIWFTLALFSFSWFVGKPGVEIVPYLIILVLLINISWLEWTSRCEDRVRVQRVAIAYNAALAAWAVHQHEEAQQRQAAKAIEGERVQQQYREMHAATEAKLAEMRGESTQAEPTFAHRKAGRTDDDDPRDPSLLLHGSGRPQGDERPAAHLRPRSTTRSRSASRRTAVRGC